MGQCSHDVCPGLVENIFCGHNVHDVCPLRNPKEPDEHLVHCGLAIFEKVPGAQRIHALKPALEKLPPEQTAQEVDPLLGLKYPSGHLVQLS